MFRAFTLLLLISVVALAQPSTDRPLLIGRVAINQSHNAFTYAGKIWLVDRSGGTARSNQHTSRRNKPCFLANPAPPVKVMIINELNGSATETGAFMFKLAKVGPTVGKRTFGAGIGPYYFTPAFIDGGSIRLPNRAAYDPSGTTRRR